MIATGQSGRSLSAKCRNFLEPWAAGQYIPLGIPLATARAGGIDNSLIPAEVGQ